MGHEDGLRRKEFSKEYRPEPVVNMDLLLDVDFIPIGIDIFLGNESKRS